MNVSYMGLGQNWPPNSQPGWMGDSSYTFLRGWRQLCVLSAGYSGSERTGYNATTTVHTPSSLVNRLYLKNLSTSPFHSLWRRLTRLLLVTVCAPSVAITHRPWPPLPCGSGKAAASARCRNLVLSDHRETHAVFSTKKL